MQATAPDFFDRQKRIPGWDQELINKQVALCLGVGGLGTNVALGLCRLGVQKIFLVDKDVVDVHNLNRQILFSKEDIGTPKVEAAARALKHHSLRTEIVTYPMDALKKWDVIVAAAQQSTVIFNMIDVGDYFDTAVQSLALRLRVPMILGGTFQSTITVDYCGPSGRPCWSCLSPLSDKDTVLRLVPEKITTLTNIDFIKPDAKPVGASNVYVASTCSSMMLAAWCQGLHGQAVPSRLIFYYLTFEIDKWTSCEVNPDCALCSASSQQSDSYSR